VGLGDRIFGWLLRVFTWLTGDEGEPGETAPSILARQTLTAKEKEALKIAQPEKASFDVRSQLAQDMTGEHFLSLLEADIKDPSLNPIIHYFARAMFLAFSMAGIAGPWSQRGSYWAQQFAQSGRLDAPTGFLAQLRGELTYGEAESDLADQGFDSRRIAAIESTLWQWLPDDALIELVRRGYFGEGRGEEILKYKGYTPESVSGIMELKDRIPGPTDLVRMAIREAWRDDVAAKWGYDQDFVGEFQEWMEKQGMGGEWPKLYWRAHWELPSLTLAREMLHRTEFSEDDFKTLLRIGDIPSGYRDLITQVMYIPYTRVDVRRMYDVDVLDKQGVYDAYRDLGFNHEKATNMTEFTIRWVEGADRELAKTEVLRGYNKGILGRDKAFEYLRNIGYREENVNFLIAIENVKIAQAIKDEKLKTYKANYVEGVWDLSELSAALGTMNLPNTEMQRYLELWGIERQRRVTRPTTAQLLSFFDGSVITEGMARDELDKKGLSDVYIDWYIADAERKKAERLEGQDEPGQARLLAQTRSPSKTELKIWWLTGLIGEPELRVRLADVDYSPDDIDNYITQWEAEEQERIDRETEAEHQARLRAKRHPTKVDLRNFVKLGYIDPETMLAEMIDQGFDPYWAVMYVTQVLEEMEAEI